MAARAESREFRIHRCAPLFGVAFFLQSEGSGALAQYESGTVRGKRPAGGTRSPGSSRAKVCSLCRAQSLLRRTFEWNGVTATPAIAGNVRNTDTVSLFCIALFPLLPSHSPIDSQRITSARLRRTTSEVNLRVIRISRLHESDAVQVYLFVRQSPGELKQCRLYTQIIAEGNRAGLWSTALSQLQIAHVAHRRIQSEWTAQCYSPLLCPRGRSARSCRPFRG